MVKKKGKKFRPNLNHVARKRKTLEKNKKKCRSTVKVIKENWETTKTPRGNALSMGLAFNPNEAVPVVQPHRDIIDMVSIDDMELAEARALGTVAEQRLKKQRERNAVLTKEKARKVVSTLESEAAEQQALRENSVRTVRLPDRDVELLIYLAERYGDDYKAMARDPKNLFQYTPKKISSLMKIYRSSGFYKVIEDPL
ncbi:Ribosome biogenesis protein Nop16 [Trichostrongylus colubriformis]|uniref:Nucleolar protein 16 n=1 Tax=Trichostrongylus colubriformis TaxID=6319 RepID=A0AAN8IY87_TRICO